MHRQKHTHSNQLLTEKWLSAKNYSPLNVYLKTLKSKSIHKDSHVKRPNFRGEIKSGTKHGCSLRSQLSPTTLHGLKPFSQLVKFLLKFNSIWSVVDFTDRQKLTNMAVATSSMLGFKCQNSCWYVLEYFLYEYLKWFKRSAELY